MKRRTEEVNGSRHAFDLREVARAAFWGAHIAVALVLTVGCVGEWRKSERLYREAERLAARGDPAAAVDRLERILRDDPRGATAARAREKITLYRGLADAVARYPQRRAREIVVAVARAIERHRAARGGHPDTLDALVPDFLDAAVTDPWGGSLLYVRVGTTSYRLTSLGADGKSGGDGDDADIGVVNGRFVKDVAP